LAIGDWSGKGEAGEKWMDCEEGLLSAIVILASSTIADQVAAHELGDFGQYLRGVTIGDPIALVLPPGLYFENTTVVAR
jgi:hypothetical protein